MIQVVITRLVLLLEKVPVVAPLLVLTHRAWVLTEKVLVLVMTPLPLKLVALGKPVA
jgi:hypothetical protein